jgi:hypothetical protein
MATSLTLGMSLQQIPFLIVTPLTLGHGRLRPPQQNCMALRIVQLCKRRARVMDHHAGRTPAAPAFPDMSARLPEHHGAPALTTYAEQAGSQAIEGGRERQTADWSDLVMAGIVGSIVFGLPIFFLLLQ